MITDYQTQFGRILETSIFGIVLALPGLGLVLIGFLAKFPLLIILGGILFIIIMGMFISYIFEIRYYDSI